MARRREPRRGKVREVEVAPEWYQRRGNLLDMVEELERDPPRVPSEVMSVKPQPKQEELLRACGLLDYYWGWGPPKPAVCSIIGYGGWPYGAKTYGMLILAATAALAFPGIQVPFFRRTYSQIFGPGGVIVDAREVFGGLGSWRDEEKQHDFNNGSQFYFRHCENEADVYKYDGQQFDILELDEATHYSWFMVNYLLRRNRVSGRNGIPRPFAVMCSNPGNIGHAMYDKLFDLGKEVVGDGGDKEYMQVKEVMDENGQMRKTYFIPSKIRDNQIGIERDPEYAARLRAADPLLEDDTLWETFIGQMFSEFKRERHVIPMRAFPASWPTLVGVDGGYDDPWCVLWGKIEPRTGRIYIYREIYQSGVTDDVQAERIRLATTKDDNVMANYADPVMWNQKNMRGEVSSTADEYLKNGVFLTQGDNNRVGGVMKIHRYLADGADGKPLLQITENCYNLINEIPKLPKDPNRPEDVDPKASADHAYAALRYLLTNVDIYIPTETLEDGPPNRRRIPQNQNENPFSRVKGL